jgi:hypothetical protein
VKAFVVSVLLAAGLPLAASAGACLPNELQLGSTTIRTEAAVFDTAYGVDGGGIAEHAGYDLRTGRIHVTHPMGLARDHVRTSDLYDVAGIPAGTALSLTVEAEVEGIVWTDGCGASGCWGWVSCEVVTPADSQAVTQGRNVFGGTQTLAFVTSARLDLVAGTPVPVEVELTAYQSAGGRHVADGDATVRFLGLPPGAHVVSCQGYLDPGTPALPASWGSLKARYR